MLDERLGYLRRSALRWKRPDLLNMSPVAAPRPDASALATCAASFCHRAGGVLHALWHVLVSTACVSALVTADER